MSVVVLVVDKTDTERCHAVADAFDRTDRSVFVVDDAGLQALGDLGRLPAARLSRVDVCVLHANDFDALPPWLQPKVLLRYTGGDPEQARRTGEDWICRPVTADAPLAKVEADELVAYALDHADGTVSHVPAVLRSRQVPDTLVALAVLCQGYLATSALRDPNGGDWGPPAIAPALKALGWDSLLTERGDEVRKLLDTARESIRAGKSPNPTGSKWWLSVLGDLESLRKAAREEWTRDGRPVSGALERLLDDLGKSEVPPQTVCDLFLALCKRLDRP